MYTAPYNVGAAEAAYEQESEVSKFRMIGPALPRCLVYEWLASGFQEMVTITRLECMILLQKEGWGKVNAVFAKQTVLIQR